MDAVVVDLKDVGLRTPEQVIRVFFEMYTHSEVKWLLFQVHALLQQANENEMLIPAGKMDRIVELFDQLTFLVEAVQLLRRA